MDAFINLLALVSSPSCQKHTFLPVVFSFPLLGFGSGRSASVSAPLPPFLREERKKKKAD